MADNTTHTGVCCTLPEPQRRARGAELRAGLFAQIVERRELVDGYALRFAPLDETIENLGRFIAFERQCCAFLRFALEVEPNGGPVWLTLTGAGQTKEVLRSIAEGRPA